MSNLIYSSFQLGKKIFTIELTMFEDSIIKVCLFLKRHYTT